MIRLIGIRLGKIILCCLLSSSLVLARSGPSLADTGGHPAPLEEARQTVASSPSSTPALQLSDPASWERNPQGENIRFQHVSLDQGLSQSTVVSILQDSQGFMWFATQDGLNRFDGYSFKVYKPDPANPNSLSHQYITALAEDQAGNLWIGTQSAGLDRMDLKTGIFTHFRNQAGDDHSLSSNYVNSLALDKNGVLWVGTSEGLNAFDAPSQTFTRYSYEPKDPYSLSNAYVTSLYADQQGVLWIGTEDGLNQFDRISDRFTRYVYELAEPGSLGAGCVNAIYQDRSGILWVGTSEGGLNRFNPASGTFDHYRHAPANPDSLSSDFVTAIYEDSLGLLWVATKGGGLSWLDRATGHFYHYRHNPADPTSLSDDFVYSIYEDRSGALWIGTFGAGINKVERPREPFLHIKSRSEGGNSLNNDVIWSFYQDHEGVLWVGTNGGGLNRYDPARREWSAYRYDPEDPESLGSNIVQAILEDLEGNLWIGTQGGGVNRFDRKSGHFFRYKHDSGNPQGLSDNTILSLYFDQKGTLWAGTSGKGLNYYDPQTDQFFNYQPSEGQEAGFNSYYFWTMIESQDGQFWIGTGGGGLLRLDRVTGEVIQYLPSDLEPNSLSSNNVLTIYPDKAGFLWLGTAGGGLNKFDPANQIFTHYRTQDGLPNDVVYGILEDGQSDLWLSTNNGLSRFDPDTETFVNFGLEDGLQSQEFNSGAYFQNSLGEMFFGGINGFNVFDPSLIGKGNPYTPPVWLTSLTQGGTSLPLDQPVEIVPAITLRWPNNYFEFEFVALSFIQPEKNQYAYKLENFDKDWNYLGTKHDGRYTNLPGGAYTLRVKGANNDGKWNEQGTALKIQVVPPVWETWWFRSLAVLVLGLLVSGGYRLRVRQVEAHAGELENLVQARTAELRQQIEQRLQVEEALRKRDLEKAIAAERSRLARELHDAVTQILFSASLIAEALPASWNKDPVEGKELLDELRHLCRGALAEMRTLLLELRPAALAEASLEDLLRQLAEAAIGREGLWVNVSTEGQSDLPAEVHIALYRIVQEALHNVIKHAVASQVAIHLRHITPDPKCVDGEQQEGVVLTVQDNGRGFDPENIPTNHLGIGIMHERAQAIGAILTIESQPGHGTQVTVLWEKALWQEAHPALPV